MKTSSTFLAFVLIAPSFIVEDSYASSPFPGGDELPPECPCFTALELVGTNQRIIDNEIKLIPQACNDDNTDGDGINQYTLAWEELSTTTTMNNHERNLQTIKMNDGKPPPPPGVINQPDNSKQYGGYVVTLNKNNGNGYCTKYPNDISDDPFNIVMMATCKNYIQDQCRMIDNMVCPCYDMDDITTLQERLMNDDVVMDVEKSCQKDHETLPYGIYLNEMEIDITSIRHDVDPFMSSVKFEAKKDMRLLGVNVDNNQCFDGSDDSANPLLTNSNQGTHCQTLVERLCETLTPPLEDKCGSRCGDDPNYKFRNKTCQQLTSGMNQRKRRRICKRKKKNNKFVFESCRDSCQMRECVDDTNFYFNGNHEKNCHWIASNKEYCAVDQVRKYCVKSCGTNCCKDNDRFSYKLSKDEYAECHFFKLNRRTYCSKKSIAYNCPRSCGKCLRDPR